jgi:membrane associated rhomboid family serine protease
MITLRDGEHQEDLAWEVWEARVRAGRVSPDTWVRFEPITGDAFVRASELESFSSLFQDKQLPVDVDVPWLTALLVGVQVRVWWWSLLPGARDWLRIHLTKWTPGVLEDGEVWRLLTMGFLHIDFTHALLNLVWLGYTGWSLERMLGRANVLTIYLASVLVGALASMWGAPATYSLGASGGVFGLVSATVVFGLVHGDNLSERDRRVYGFALLPYLILMFVSGLQNDTTDNWGHGGGLVCGIVFGLLLRAPNQSLEDGSATPWNRRVQATTLALGAAILAALAVAGPRISPLVAPTDEEHPSPAFRVPAGWEPVETWGWGRVGTSRAFQVVARVHDDVAEATRHVDDAFRADDAARSPTTLAGLTAEHQRTVSDGVVVERWMTRRGRWTLAATWRVETSAESRLSPLRDRLVGGITWPEPERLADARAAHAAHPEDARSTAALARALDEVGDVPGALALWSSLPYNEEVAVGMLNLAEHYPNALPSLDAEVDRALALQGSQRIAVAAADALVARGDAVKTETDRRAEAIGVLDLAWWQTPGDRHVKTARVKAGLPIRLLDGRPTGPRVPGGEAPTLARARELGVAWLTLAARAERDALNASTFAEFERALAVLATGEPTLDGAVRATLERVMKPTAPRPAWLPEPVYAVRDRFNAAPG